MCCLRFSETEVKRPNLVKAAAASSSEDELEVEEQQRQRDIKERDEYASRVKDRDKEKTRKVVSKSEQKVNLVVVSLPHSQPPLNLLISDINREMQMHIYCILGRISVSSLHQLLIHYLYTP